MFYGFQVPQASFHGTSISTVFLDVVSPFVLWVVVSSLPPQETVAITIVVSAKSNTKNLFIASSTRFAVIV